MTPEQLVRIYGCSLMRAANWSGSLTDAMALFGIDTPPRQAAFIAQVGHESGRLQYTAELWGPTPAQKGYEGRADLGNTHPGDGFKFRGHGLIQVTGRANHAAARDGLRKMMQNVPDFEDEPQLLEAPKWAAYSAGQFWQARGLNKHADSGDFDTLTRRINGGLNGIDDRRALLEKASAVLSA